LASDAWPCNGNAEYGVEAEEADQRDSRPERALHWVYERLHLIFISIGGLLSTLGSAYIGFSESAEKANSSWAGRSVVAGLALVAIGSVLSWKRDPGYRKLKSENDHLRRLLEEGAAGYFEMFERHLAILSKKLRLGNTERISVYRHVNLPSDSFVMLSRYSENPIFTERGRGIYPASEGCIGQAWRDGESIVQNLPDPDVERDRYLTAQLQQNMPRTTTDRFKMKSRSYAAFRLRDSKENRQVAVVVLESLNPTGLDTAKVRSMMTGTEGEQLVGVIRHSKNYEPSPSIATKAGF